MTDSEFFYDFVYGEENRFCIQVLIKFADESCENPEPILLIGPSGTGKTHLLTALYRRMSTKPYPCKVSYQTGNTLIENILHRISDKDERHLSCYMGLDMLLIDDFSFLVGKRSVQQELIFFIESLKKQGTLILCTVSDGPIITEPIVSRFPGVVLQFAPPSNDTIRRLIEIKASQLNFSAPNKELIRTAVASRGNGFLIEGALKRCAFQNVFADTYI